MAAICSTRSWWAAKSLSKASCFFFKAFNSGKRHERKSCVRTPQIFYHFLSSPHKGIHQKNVDADKFLTWDDSSSSLPWVQLSWMSDLCLNFLAKCSKRSNLLDKKLALTFYKRIARENSKAVSSTFLNEWKIEATSRAKMVIKTKYVALGGAERHVSTRLPPTVLITHGRTSSSRRAAIPRRTSRIPPSLSRHWQYPARKEKIKIFWLTSC